VRRIASVIPLVGFVVKDVTVPMGTCIAVVMKCVAVVNPLMYFRVKDVAVPMRTSIIIIAYGATAQFHQQGRGHRGH